MRLRLIESSIMKNSVFVDNEQTEDFLQLAAEIFECPRETLSLSTRRGSVSGWDSVNHLRLVMETERCFGVKYTLEQIPVLETLGDFVDKIQ